MLLTDDDDKNVIDSSEGRSTSPADENINNTFNSAIIPTKLVLHLRPYWNYPMNDRRSDCIYWVARLDDCLESDKRSQDLSKICSHAYIPKIPPNLVDFQ